MTELNLEEIEARWDEATEGPWVFQPWSAHLLPSGDYAESILMANASSDGELCRGLFDADGEAIAHARRDVPALIAEARRLRAQIERVRELHKRAHAVGTRTGLRYEDPCPDCDGKKGAHDCGCWGAFDTEFVCAECHRLGSDARGVYDYTYPCPTIQALDAPKGICDHDCESVTGLCIVDHKSLGGDGE